jgi:hypothetical protein
MPTRTATASARPTAVAEAEADYEVLVSSTSVDRRLLSGPFASHVWGGRYEVQRFAGEGSQGATFIGTDLKTGATVAMKLFDLGKAKDWKAQELFEREVATLKRLNHKGIPQFLDVIVDDATGARCLVMTHVAGDTLGEVQRRDGIVAEKRLWGFVVDAANVLAAVHGEGVVHRDLKPDNFILRPDGTLAIVDFGGVGTMRAAAGSTVVGTFGYMAPEQLYGAQTAATDLYALGATLLTLATNKSPEDQPRKGLAIDVDAAAPFLSEPLRKLLSTLLSPDPQARPKDGAALLLVLRDVATNKNRPTRPPEVLPADSKAVDAIWRDDDVDEAVQATSGALGVVFSVIGMLATFGFGCVLIPLVLTILSTFVGQQDRQKLLALRSTVRARSRDAQRLLQRSATQSAATLEEASERRRGGRSRRREQRRLEKLEARAQWTADKAERFARQVEEHVAREVEKHQQKQAKRANKAARKRKDSFWHDDSEEL